MHSQGFLFIASCPIHSGSSLYAYSTASHRCNDLSNVCFSLVPRLLVSDLEGRADGSQEASLFKGLLQESQALRAYRSRLFQLSFVCRDKNGVLTVPRLSEVALQVNAAHPGQQKVEDEQKRAPQSRVPQEVLGRVEGLDLPVSRRSQQPSHGPANRGVIIDDEYGAARRRHRVPVMISHLPPFPSPWEKRERADG